MFSRDDQITSGQQELTEAGAGPQQQRQPSKSQQPRHDQTSTADWLNWLLHHWQNSGGCGCVVFSHIGKQAQVQGPEIETLCTNVLIVVKSEFLIKKK